MVNLTFKIETLKGNAKGTGTGTVRADDRYPQRDPIEKITREQEGKMKYLAGFFGFGAKRLHVFLQD